MMKKGSKNVSVLVIVLCSLCIISCKKNTSILDLNVEKESLQHKVLKLDSELYKIGYICVFDSLLFVKDETRDAYFTLINLNSNEVICRFGEKGKGPGEMKWPLFITCNEKHKTFEVNAIQPKGLVVYHIDSLINENVHYKPTVLKFDVDKNSIYSVDRLGNSLFIAKGGFHAGQFAIINELGELLSVQGNYPTEEESVHQDQYILGKTYQGFIKTHPQLPKFVYTSLVGSIIEFCDLDNKNNLKKYRFYYSDYPRFRVSGYNSALYSDNIVGYSSLYTTGKYVYVLYSEENVMNYEKNPYMFNTILKFNWDGELVKKYTTDIQIRTIAVSSDDKVIYGTSANPVPKIVKFEL